ncbi:MAG: NAD(+)/NADH kinase [Clostridiales bacterium]|nr:NAD(+)/NADH kinase [Clostridiales bacterium]
MNALVYDNKGKDINAVWLKKLIKSLDEAEIPSRVIDDDDLSKDISADVLFVLGGDGTILCLNEFANRNNIPMIGINIGKLGFLSEFESSEIDKAVSLFKSGELKKDVRIAIDVFYDKITYCALNDVFVQRVYSEDVGCMITEVKVAVDDTDTCSYKGDGVILCTPTGATAYSLSAGGSILAPKVEAFSVTPIAVHDFNQRPIVYSSDSTFKFKITGDVPVGLFADGHFIANLKKGDTFIVKKALKPTVFLRKQDFNFFKRLNHKFRSQRGE